DQLRHYRLFCILFGFLLGVVLGAPLGALSFYLGGEPINNLLTGAIFGGLGAVAVFAILFWFRWRIHLLAFLHINRRRALQGLAVGGLIGIVIGIPAGLILEILSGTQHGGVYGLVGGGTYLALTGMILSGVNTDVQESSYTNQGIRESGYNALKIFVGI